MCMHTNWPQDEALAVILRNERGRAGWEEACAAGLEKRRQQLEQQRRCGSLRVMGRRGQLHCSI